MTLDQVKNYAEHSGNPIIRDLCEMVLTLDASNARAHECAEREKARVDAAEAESLEQARLLGIGGSREAALIARAEKAESERDAAISEIGRISRDFGHTKFKLEQAEEQVKNAIAATHDASRIDGETMAHLLSRAEKAEAAAPQLLKALEEVLRLNGGWASLQVGFPQSAYSSERERTDCVSKARAAIAKAKGESK